MANAAARRRGQSRKSARSRRLERQELPKISSRPPVFLVWIFSISNPHAHFQESIRHVATQNTVCSWSTHFPGFGQPLLLNAAG
jgi:hypothetical protein